MLPYIPLVFAKAIAHSFGFQSPELLLENVQPSEIIPTDVSFLSSLLLID